MLAEALTLRDSIATLTIPSCCVKHAQVTYPYSGTTYEYRSTVYGTVYYEYEYAMYSRPTTLVLTDKHVDHAGLEIYARLPLNVRALFP